MTLLPINLTLFNLTLTPDILKTVKLVFSPNHHFRYVRATRTDVSVRLIRSELSLVRSGLCDFDDHEKSQMSSESGNGLEIESKMFLKNDSVRHLPRLGPHNSDPLWRKNECQRNRAVIQCQEMSTY